MKKRLFALLLALAMLFALLPGQAAAITVDTPDPDEGPIYILEDQTVVPSDAFTYVNEASKADILEEVSEYPSKYDLRDQGLVTSVKLQNPFGSCWAFAAASAVETSLLSSNIAQRLGYDVDTLDVSERHLAFFAMSPILDKSHSQYSEGRYVGNREATAAEKMHAGGNSTVATSFFSNEQGPVLEDSDHTFEYGEDGWNKDYRFIGGSYQPFCYSMDNDWSVPDELRFNHDIVLKNSIILPSPAGLPEGSEYGYKYDEAGTAAIKKMLMDGYSVTIGFLADQSQPNQDISELHFISENWAHYSNFPQNANHAVCIVGWDDDYDVSNFLPALQNEIPGNGAWLVKNSWGSGEEEFPNKGEGTWGIENEDGVNTGYFWLSYYDQSIQTPETFEFELVSEDEKTDILDAYDFMPPSAFRTAETEEPIKFANMFYVDSARELVDIGFATTHPGTKVHYEVHIMNFANPMADSGVTVAQGDTEYEFGGFHRVSLEEPVLLMKGQYYSIVVTMQTPDGKYTAAIPVNVGRDGSGAGALGVINHEESLIYIDGSWKDLDDDFTQEYFLPEELRGLEVDNFQIKGYCRSVDNNLSATVVGPESVTLCRNRRVAYYSLRFTGNSDTLPAESDIEWKIADYGLSPTFEPKPGTEIVIIEPVEGSGGSKVKLTGLDQGSVSIYAEIKGLGYACIQMQVYGALIDGSELTENGPRVFTGEPIEPEVVSVNLKGDVLIEGEEVITSFKDNTYCGVATVIVKGIGDYEPEYPSDNIAAFFAIIPQKAEIIGTPELKGTTLTVKVKDQSESKQTGYCIGYRPVGTEKWQYAESTDTTISVELRPGVKYEVMAQGWQHFDDVSWYYGLIENDYYGEPSEIFTTELIPFKDVTDESLFYYDYIYNLAGDGIVTGYGDGTFRPFAECNRVAVVTFLWRASGKPEPSSEATFSDMTDNEEFNKAISWAAEQGITTGWDDNTFRPYRTVNRAAVVTFLWRAAGEPEAASEASFSDMTDNEDFNKAISWAAEKVITTGWDDNTFRPWRTCNRLAIASFIARYLGK